MKWKNTNKNNNSEAENTRDTQLPAFLRHFVSGIHAADIYSLVQRVAGSFVSLRFSHSTRNTCRSLRCISVYGAVVLHHSASFCKTLLRRKTARFTSGLVGENKFADLEINVS